MALRRENAQVAIISLWVAVILALMAVSLGHRLSMGLRLSGYQKDKLKSLYQAKSGLNLAVSGLESDDLSYDALTDTWAQDDEDGLVEVVDEERKININTASKELLTALLEEYNFTDIEAKANNILIWRGAMPDEAKIYEGLGYPCKGAAFTNREELLLVKDFGLEDYRLLKDMITVYSGDKVNINTASEDVLVVLGKSLAVDNEQKNCVEAVVDDIIKQRGEKKYFDEMGDIETRDVVSGTSADEDVFNNLKNQLIVQSNNFMIESKGRVKKSTTTIITAIYERINHKIIYWHEN